MERKSNKVLEQIFEMNPDQQLYKIIEQSRFIGRLEETLGEK